MLWFDVRFVGGQFAQKLKIMLTFFVILGGLASTTTALKPAVQASTRRDLLGAAAAVATVAVPPAFAADPPESDLARAMREAAGKKTAEPRTHG